MATICVSAGPAFDAALNLTETIGANNATATFTGDGMRRQKSQTLPIGQVVTQTYGLGSAPDASWHKEPQNFQFSPTMGNSPSCVSMVRLLLVRLQLGKAKFCRFVAFCKPTNNTTGFSRKVKVRSTRKSSRK